MQYLSGHNYLEDRQMHQEASLLDVNPTPSAQNWVRSRKTSKQGSIVSTLKKVINETLKKIGCREYSVDTLSEPSKLLDTNISPSLENFTPVMSSV